MLKHLSMKSRIEYSTCINWAKQALPLKVFSKLVYILFFCQKYPAFSDMDRKLTQGEHE